MVRQCKYKCIHTTHAHSYWSLSRLAHWHFFIFVDWWLPHLQRNAQVRQHLCAICEGAAGNMQLHQELAPGGGWPERAAVGAASDVRHEQRAGGDHPQPADVARDLLIALVPEFIA